MPTKNTATKPEDKDQEGEGVILQGIGILIGYLILITSFILIILMAYMLTNPFATTFLLSGQAFPSNNTFDNTIFCVMVGCVVLFLGKSVVSSPKKIK